MIKRILIVFTLYFSIGLLSVIVYSCDKQQDVKICDIIFEPGHVFRTNPDEPFHFKDEIFFSVWSITESPSCYIPQLNIIESCYAAKDCYSFQNKLNESSYELYFSKPLYYNNDTIEANTDIMKNAEILGQITIRIREECTGVLSTIYFEQPLFQSLAFQEGVYDVKFVCLTDDFKEFEKYTKVYFVE